MTHTIVGLPGDGIGPEIFAAMQAVLAAAGVDIVWHEHELAGANGLLNPEAVTAIEKTFVAIKGPTGTPLGEGHRSYNVQLREAFQLFANVRPIRTLPGIQKPGMRDDVDLVIFRENLEDLYIGEECSIDGGAEAISRITHKGSERITQFAAWYMIGNGRSQIVVGAKSNILKKTHGLFQEVCMRVLEGEGIDVKHVIPDALAAQLVARPEAFDCIVLPNFLGDLFSDMCATFMGGLGVAPGANIGASHAVFEAVHGTAPDIAGKGVANPTALILSSCMMLEHIGETSAAKRIRLAIDAVYTKGDNLTGDMAQKGAAAATTTMFTQALCEEILRAEAKAA